MPARLIQAKASLLLAVFLAAGTSLPSLDAIAYHHQSADAQRWQTHVEPAGACLDHAGQCVLGRTATGSGAAVARAGEVRAEPPVEAALLPLPTPPDRGHHRGAIPQPRAPPGLRIV